MEYMLKSKMVFDKKAPILNIFSLYVLCLETESCRRNPHIENIFQNSYCSVNVNNMLMDWFDTNAVIKHGYFLSPTMFGIFINDIVEDIKSVNIGIEIDGVYFFMQMILYYLVTLKKEYKKPLDKVYKWSL